MITAYTGRQGSGKTFSLISKGEELLEKDCPVFANFPLEGTTQISMDHLSLYHFPSGCVLLIDEIASHFKFIDQLLDIYHNVQMDLFIAVQHLNQVDEPLRKLVKEIHLRRDGD